MLHSLKKEFLGTLNCLTCPFLRLLPEILHPLSQEIDILRYQRVDPIELPHVITNHLVDPIQCLPVSLRRFH
ncbi:MAG: hypothetical protein UY85_C0054G0005 [Candidatus Peribacteria bacterium GW2011_GWB1_54_5]|nr:MAG: hypothetical protein UY85_C0054G0005 [Candidatus Peribacteria bacterium GW2011_GWB1_54_5]